MCICTTKLRSQTKKDSWSDGKKVRPVNNNRAYHEWPTSAQPPLGRCRSALYFKLDQFTKNVKKKGLLEWMSSTSCRDLEWRWCDSWIRLRRHFQYLAQRCQNCHITAKSSLRDQTFSLIRLPEGYVSLNSNIKSSNMTSFIIITHFRRSRVTYSFGNEYMELSRVCNNHL